MELRDKNITVIQSRSLQPKKPPCLCGCKPVVAIIISYFQVFWVLISMISEICNHFGIEIHQPAALFTSAAYLPLWPFLLLRSTRTTTVIVAVSSFLLTALLALLVHVGVRKMRNKLLLPFIVFDIANIGCAVWLVIRHFGEWGATKATESLTEATIGQFIPIVLLLFIVCVLVQCYRALGFKYEQRRYPSRIYYSPTHSWSLPDD